MMEAAMIIRRMEEELKSDYQIELVEASTPQIHKALSNAVMYAISDNWRKARREHEHVRRAYYFSAEYLMGRMVFNNLYCLGILDQIRDLLRARGCDSFHGGYRGRGAGQRRLGPSCRLLPGQRGHP